MVVFSAKKQLNTKVTKGHKGKPLMINLRVLRV